MRFHLASVMPLFAQAHLSSFSDKKSEVRMNGPVEAFGIEQKNDSDLFLRCAGVRFHNRPEDGIELHKNVVF
jgi:hypothetical protein